MSAPPAVVVHSAAQAAAALAAAGPRGVTLLSTRGAASSLGAPWFLALVAEAAASHPGIPHQAVLDCADAPGHVIAGLRAGARLLVLDGTVPGFAALARLAACNGAALWSVRPLALDLARLDLRRPGGRNRLAEWLSSAPR